MIKKCLFIAFVLCTIVQVTFAQTFTADGKVLSAEDGEPIVGATVRVTSSNVGTITNIDGLFSLDVPENSTLTISYIGLKSVSLPAAKKMVINLAQDSENLQEVIVTAMGISRDKKALGYAVQDVKADEITKGANNSLSGALQGKVSGLEISPSSGMPGASAKITIRGSRSFTGDNTPLYVVDGMPIASTSDYSTEQSVTGADMSSRSLDIDPNDIESINVLKGQAASALYGLRASNGVIIITTKSGKNAPKGKPMISISTSASMDKTSVLPEYQTKYAQGGWVKADDGSYYIGYNPTASTSWGPLISELPNDPKYGGNTDNAYTQKYGMQNGKYYVPQRATAGLDPWVTPQAYNNIEDFFQTGYTWSNSVNIAQATDIMNYSVSLGNTTQEGIIPSTSMDRYNAKFSAEGKLNKNWTAGFVGNFVQSNISKQSTANNGIVATVYGSPASYDLKGIPSHKAGEPTVQNTYRSTTGFDAAYWAVENNKFTEKNQRFFGNAYLKYSTKFNSVNHKMDVKYQLGTDAYTSNNRDLWAYGHADGTGEIEVYGLTNTDFNSLLTANYSWTISDKWSFDAIIGNELIDTYVRTYYEYGQGFSSPGWNHMNNATSFVAEESFRRKRTVGNFASLSLSYNNMLYLNATGRQDVVSSMPRGNRTFYYPSVSAGFIFTEIEPLKNNVLTYGKLRASYAQVGQAGTYYDSYYSTPAYGSGFYSGTPIQYPYNGVTSYTPYFRVYDPNLKPQNTESYEIGGDFGFFNGLLSLGYTYSRQNVKDQIFNVPLAGSTGSSQYVTNGGSIHTDAHELNVTFNPIRKKNIDWSVSANFTKIDNYVDKLADGVESIFLGGFADPQIRAGIGYTFPVIYGQAFKRNENGDIVVDSNGMPQVGEMDVIGKVSPDFILGFSTSIDIYKFRLSATFDWKKGGQMYCGSYNTMGYYGTTQQSLELRESKGFLFERDAVKMNDDGTYSKNDILISGEDAWDYLDIMSSISEGGVHNSSYLKLREVSLSYPVWNKKGVEVNLSLFARNILLWTELPGGFDPESSQGNTNMSGGFERFSLPSASSYGFGLNVKF